MTELLDVVDDLTLPKIHRIDREVLKPILHPETGQQMVDEAGNDRWVTVGVESVPVRSDALLQQLMDAITASMGGPSGKGKLAHERLPLDADALGRAIRITATIGKWCVEQQLRPTKDPLVDLRAWYAATLSVNGFDPDGTYLATLQGWVREVEGLLNPWDQADLPDPCPRCGETEWWADGDIPDTAGRPRPLVFKFRRADGEQIADRAWAHCRACDPDATETWRLEELRDLIAEKAA